MMEIGIFIAIIVGVSEVFKKSGLRAELIPLLNVINGVLINLTLNGFTAESALYGAIIGLAACGLFDQSKICKLIKEL